MMSVFYALTVRGTVASLQGPARVAWFQFPGTDDPRQLEHPYHSTSHPNRRISLTRGNLGKRYRRGHPFSQDHRQMRRIG